MYREHVPVISTAMREDYKTFKRGVMFAVLSARQPFLSVPDQLEELARDGSDAQCLFAWKYDAYLYLEEHGRDLWHRVRGAETLEQALWEITRVPGIGLVKGAFILQLMGFDIACLDSRNIAREGRNPRAYRSDGLKDGKAWRAKIARYIADVGGRAQHYWDTWCDEIGERTGEGAETISAIHLCFVPKKYRTAPPIFVASGDIPL